MRLLFDANLWFWGYARGNDLTIVTKDSDFGDLGLARGFPPKIIWLRLGNCTTHAIERLLRECKSIISAFDTDPNVGILTLV